MKQFLRLLALLILALSIMGCGPSLKEYFSTAQSFNSQVSTTAQVEVWIEPANVAPNLYGNLGILSDTINTASAIASIAISGDQEKRLSALISSEIMVAEVDASFRDTFASQTQLEVVGPEIRNPDMRIIIRLQQFGLYSSSLIDPIAFHVTAEISVIHVPTLKRIYYDTVSLYRPVSELVGSNYIMGNIITSAFNLTSFFKLTDEDLVRVFYMMAKDSGNVLASRLTNSIYR